MRANVFQIKGDVMAYNRVNHTSSDHGPMNSQHQHAGAITLETQVTVEE